jgi:hypothetical protein
MLAVLLFTQSHARLCFAAAANTPAGRAAKKLAKSAAKQDKKNVRIKEQRAAEAAAGGKKAVPALQSETEAFSKAIKGMKSRARALMQQQGMTAKAAQKIAAKEVTGKGGIVDGAVSF